jgi:hypothetical protein
MAKNTSNLQNNSDPPRQYTHLTRLPDEETPFNEPDDIPRSDKKAIDDTHPATDANIEAEEEYDKGLSGAAEAAEPNFGNAVTSYKSPKKRRKETSK